jgi:hypothetical protein
MSSLSSELILFHFLLLFLRSKNRFSCSCCRLGSKVFIHGHGDLLLLYYNRFLGNSLNDSLGLGLGGSRDRCVLIYGSLVSAGLVFVRSPISTSSTSLLGLLAASSSRATVESALSIASFSGSPSSLGVAIVVVVRTTIKEFVVFQKVSD